MLSFEINSILHSFAWFRKMDFSAIDKLQVLCEDMDEDREYPHCVHGPTILIYKRSKGPNEGYFVCSAYRDRNLCNFFKPAKSVNRENNNRITAIKYANTVIESRNNVRIHNIF